MTTATLTAPPPAAVTGCCPPFEPTAWHQREVVWADEPFVKLRVPTLLHVPVGMGKRVLRAMKLIDAAGAAPRQPLMLSDDRSPWHSELFIHVTRPVPGAELVRLSGTFMTRVYDGPYREMGRWAAELRRWVEGRGRSVEQVYFAYPMCPACAKAYGHNWVIGFAKIAGA